MTERLRVDVADGKYTVIQTEDGDLEILRHGEPWPRGTEAHRHSGFVLALAQEIEALREAGSERVRHLENLLQRATAHVPIRYGLRAHIDVALASTEPDRDECPDGYGEECQMCSGEYCAIHHAEPCDCDVVERHSLEQPEPNEPGDDPVYVIDAAIEASAAAQRGEFLTVRQAAKRVRDKRRAEEWTVPEAGSAKVRAAFFAGARVVFRGCGSGWLDAKYAEWVASTEPTEGEVEAPLAATDTEERE